MGKAVARGAIRFGSLLDEQGCLLRRGLLIPLNEGRFPRISSRLAGHRTGLANREGPYPHFAAGLSRAVLLFTSARPGGARQGWLGMDEHAVALTAESVPPQRYAELDALCGVAALAVLLFHIYGNKSPDHTRSLRSISTG
jgi:hypothetical protein